MKIHDYVREGNIKAVSRLINQGVYIDCVDKKNSYQTPLMIAVSNPDVSIDMVSFLVKNGADVNAQKYQTLETPLYYAVTAGEINKVRFLLDAGADINYRNYRGSNVFAETIYGEYHHENLLPILNLLIERGAEINDFDVIKESALKNAFARLRFDAVELLLDAGADKKQLNLSELMEAVAFGSVEDVKNLLEEGADIYDFDHCGRNAVFLSLELQDFEKTKLILPFTPSYDDYYFWWKSPLFYPIEKDDSKTLKCLIEKGFDVNTVDYYTQETLLMIAASSGATNCVQILLEAGANAVAKNKYGDTVISKAINLEIVKMLHARGGNLSDINNDMQLLLRGCVDNKQLELDKIKTKDKTSKNPRFGITNPEIIKNEFWEAMIRSNVGAYAARSDDDSQDIPIWCYQRFGKTITMLPDGRIVEIAGEHEDFYDPDFCIYNDVVVSDGKGNFQIYGYPKEVFPPTDFHTATLANNYIYIIGSLGYVNQRIPDETPVYRLNCKTFKIEKITTTGNKPGWISRHKAEFQQPSQIYITGGKLWKIIDGKYNLVDNTSDYILNLNNFEWSRVNP